MSYSQLLPSLNQVLIFLLFFLITRSHSTQSCTQEQRSALLQFVTQFEVGERSPFCRDYAPAKVVSWKEGTDCCLWNGVECDNKTSQVIGIDLSCGRLHGSILHPNNTLFFHSFPHLQRLNLAFNHFNYSPIPLEVSGFTRLTHLNLSSSYFSGDVPIELSFLTQLVSLDLSKNDSWRLKLLPDAFELFAQNLTKLREVNLGFVDLSSVNSMSFLVNLTSLTSLHMPWCELNGKFPDGIFNLPYLESLDVGENDALSGHFPELLNSSSPLQYLDLSLTQFSGALSESFSNLKSLKEFYLRGCKFYGSLPGTLGNLTKITNLDLAWNNFAGPLPPQVVGLPELRELYLNSNSFSGKIPSWIFALQALEFLKLDNNKFTGPLPPQVVGLPELRELYMRYSSFTGKIPAWIFALQALEHLDLSYNKFNGHITELGSTLLENLCTLDLSNNYLTGPLPSRIIGLPSLKSLSLDHNIINGTIPSWVFDLPNLSGLFLGNNKFTGRITELGSALLENLGTLDLSNNSLTGPLPSQITGLPSLNSLSLGRNGINGTIPSWAFCSPTLNQLDLSHNKLTGPISEFCYSNASLEVIQLSHNNLHGELPKSIFKMQKLDTLMLSSNNLGGNVDLSMSCQTNMDTLDLSSNRFSGALPPCLGDSKSHLSVLDLGKNSFSGTIPDTFAERNGLETINLNDNGFEGPIPKSLVNCSFLQVLDLGNNNFTDKFPHWLDSLPRLQVLVLRSNRFHGVIGASKTKFPFPKLRVIDVSHNYFIGPLPKQYFKKFTAMMNIDETEYELWYIGPISGFFTVFNRGYYQNSLTMTIKGSTVEMEKVLNIFVAIDLSSNKFEGEIQEILGMLNSIRGLNLSHNRLTGHIPISLGNLTKLEWLDLSSNKLAGKIPQQLTNLNFLEVLNLSYNQLIGSIPQGNQFDTFSNDSYIGNSGLCGFPLSNICSNIMAPQPPLTTSVVQEEEGDGFVWEVILPGYGCGLVFGLVMGYLIFSTGRPRWLVRKIVEHAEQIKIENRLKKRSKRNRGRRN